MSKCQFKSLFRTFEWDCPLDAEESTDFCYWHQKIKGKEQIQEKLAELKGKKILFVFLQEAILMGANLQKVNLENANLQEAILEGANLQEANLDEANLQKARLMGANLQEANLAGANLQKANLGVANLQKACLGEANLQEANLELANLQEAYLGLANLQKACLERANLQEANLEEANLADSKMTMAVFDAKSRLDGSNLKNANLYRSYIDFAKSLRDATIFEKEDLSERETNEQRADEEIGREKKYALYRASLEVYNKLYHFYSDEGMDFRAKHGHYRRAEVTRKLLRVRHKWNTKEGMYDRIRSWGFDFLILKTLTGYGDSILRPILISAFCIFAFGFLFLLQKGVEVENRNVQILDYFYLSLTTFTGFGFSNVQPDITVPLMQPLIMLESAFGVAMIALIIFVITYQISR